MELSIQLCSYYQKKLCFAPRPADRNAILLKQAAPNSYDRILSLFYRKMSRTSTICNLYYHLLYEALRNNVAIITTIRVHFIASEPAWLRAWCAFSFCVYPIIGGPIFDKRHQQSLDWKAGLCPFHFQIITHMLRTQFSSSPSALLWALAWCQQSHSNFDVLKLWA